MNPVVASDSAQSGSGTERTAPARTLPVYRVLLHLPAELHSRMSERSRRCGRETYALYQTALDVFARNLACGVRPPPTSECTDPEVLVQLPADRRAWLRRLSSRLCLPEGDIVAAAADWWLSGGALPGPTPVSERRRRPSSTRHLIS